MFVPGLAVVEMARSLRQLGGRSSSTKESAWGRLPEARVEDRNSLSWRPAVLDDCGGGECASKPIQERSGCIAAGTPWRSTDAYGDGTSLALPRASLAFRKKAIA